MRVIRRYRASAVATIVTMATFGAFAQDTPTIIESEGEATIPVAPDEVGFRLERRFSGPTLTDAMKQVRAFERSVAQGVTDLELAMRRQDTARVRVGQRPIGLDASVELWIAATPADRAADPAETLIEIAERVRKLGVTVSADVRFAGYAVVDREPIEQEAVARAAENALYLADAAGALAQRQVVDVERLRIIEAVWEGVAAPADGIMPVPAAVACRARIHISYRYEPDTAR